MATRRSGLEGLDQDLREQARFLADRLPAYERLLEVVCGLLADGGGPGAAVAQRLREAWGGRSFVAVYDRPLLLLAAIRADALRDGPAHPLHAAVAAGDPDAGAVTDAAVLAALGPARTRLWEALRDRHVQTNETSRAVAWLWPAWLAGCGGGRGGGRDGGARPLSLVDLGASAGLNLIADELPRPWTVAGNGALPTATEVQTEARVGIDARPVDVCDDEQVAWLTACVWPGEHARLERLAAAVATLRRARREGRGPELRRAELRQAPALLRELSRTSPAGTLVLAYQTLVREYLPPAVLAAYERELQAWLRDEAPGTAAWIELETGDAAAGVPPAALVAHVRARQAEPVRLVLARCAYHPTELVVDPAAADAFRAATAPPGGS